MKVLAIVLLCAVAAVQGRSAGVQISRNSQPARGDVPYLAHLRLATGTTGLLGTGVGSLISNNWVLTAASIVDDSRFIWFRFGAVNVIQPELVIESNSVTSNPGFDASTGANNIALINLGRFVESTVNVAPLGGLGGILNPSERFCGFGQDDSGSPGEQLFCYELSLTQNGRGYSGSSSDAAIRRFDIGAPIVSDGQQTGILTATDDEGVGIFTPIAEYVSWVESVTNIDFTPEPESEA